MRTLLGILSHIALLLTIFLLVPIASYAQQGTVTGQVVAQPTGEPVQGAAVSIQDTDLQATTSEDGQFRMEGVPAGTQVVQARLEGYKAQGRAVSVPIGAAAEVRLELRPKSSSKRGTSSDADETGPSPSCSAVTVPESWVATSSGRRGKAHELRGQTYRVRTYMAPVLDDGAETLTNENSTLARIPTRAPGPSRLQEDTPISSKAELLAVMGHVMNTDAPVSRGGRFLSVDHPVEWGERADKWRTARQEAFDPDDGKIASGLLLGGKLLGSVGISMAGGWLEGAKQAKVLAGAAFEFVLQLGTQTLNYFESVTATPRDKSLAPAMRALADLDSKYQNVSLREKLKEVQAREYINRYMDIRSDAAEMAGALKFAAEEWSDVSSAVRNYRAAQDPIIAGTPMGETAITNAHDFFSSAAIGAGEKVMTELLFWEIDKLSKGVNRYLFTANFYLTVLEAYARLLENRNRELSRPGSLGSWSAYSEALSRYQYRVALYHEVRLGLMTNLYQYSNRLDDTGFGQGEAAIPDETIERYRGLRNEQRETYAAIREEISTQMQVLDAVEEGYPDFEGQDCLTDDFRRPEEPGDDEDAGEEDPPVADGGEDPTSDDEGDTRGGDDLGTDQASTGAAMLGANPARTGHYPGSGPEGPVRQKWRFEADGGVGSPVAANGTVYAGSRDNHLYALDAQTGQEQWRFEADDSVGPPAVANGTVYVGSEDSHLYAIDVQTGQEQWRFEADDVGLPAVADGTVYAVSQFKHLYAVDVQTGREQWRFEVDNPPHWKALAVADGTVYAGGIYSPLYAVDAQTGRERWRFEAYGVIAPAIADGTVYAGSKDGHLYALGSGDGTSDNSDQGGSRSTEEQEEGNAGRPTSDITLETQGQDVLARSGENVEWRYATTRPEPSVSKRNRGVAYVTDGKGYRAEASHVYALEVTTGDLLWQKEIGGYTQAEVLRVRGGTLIVEHSSGIYALNAETGGTLWVYDEFDDETTSYTFAEGMLLFLDGMPSSAHEMMGSRSPSTLHAVNLETGQGRWSKAVVPERHPRPTSHARYSVEGKVVTAKNTRTGRAYQLDLKSGKEVADSGPSRCGAGRSAEVARSSLSRWSPVDEAEPALKADLNEDGVAERFYESGAGPKTRGRFKVIAISGEAPCQQVLSFITYKPQWEEEFTRLGQTRNGYHILEIEEIKYAFDGEKYVKAD